MLKFIGVICAFVAGCEFLEYLFVRRGDAEVFPPKLGWRILRSILWGASFLAAVLVARRPSWPFGLYIASCIICLLWLNTVTVNSSGISSSALFGLRTAQIRWDEVARISSDWQEQKVRGVAVATGFSIAVINRDGSKILSPIANSGQGRFLDALRRYVPREAFDAGLYDWHP